MSLIASVVALVQVTGKAATMGYGYAGAVKDAPKDIVKLSNELQTLGDVLKQLHQQTSGTTPPRALLPALEAPLRECAVEIKDLQSQVKLRTGVKKLIHRLKWPLKEKETKDAISRIGRLTNSINLILTADQK